MRTRFRYTLSDLQALDPSILDFGDTCWVTNDSTAANIGLYRLAYNASSARKSDDSNWVRTREMNRTVLPADVANSAADTLADVTALSFPVKSGKKYQFKFFVVYSAAATTTGSRWTVNVADAPTTLFYQSTYSLTTTSQTVNTGLGAVQLPAAASASSAATTGNIAIVEGIIVPSADGTVILQSASEVNGSAITAKALLSFVDYSEI
jgi:hypothetical protein